MSPVSLFVFAVLVKAADAIAGCDSCHIEKSHSKNGDSDNFIEELISFYNHLLHALEEPVKGVEGIVDATWDAFDGRKGVLELFAFHY